MSTTSLSTDDLERLAEDGDVSAQYDLSGKYLCVPLGERNLERGLYWLEKAAAAGNPDAMCDLGVHHHEGDGVERDWKKAFEFYRAAAEQGFAHAEYHVGLCFKTGDGVERTRVELLGMTGQAPAVPPHTPVAPLYEAT